MSDNDVDAQFADIVAHWDDATVDPDRRPLGRTDPAEPVDSVEPVEPVDPVDSVEPLSPQDPGRDDDTTGDTTGEAATTLLERDPQPGLPPGTNPAPGANPPAIGGIPPAIGGIPPAIGGIPIWRGAQVTPEEVWEAVEEEHFEPGPTAPLPPQEDIQFWGIIVGLVGGPLLLLWLVLVRPNVSTWWTLLALGLSIGGFVLLVMRQPHHRDEDDPHDGAVV